MNAEQLCREYSTIFKVPTCSVRIFSAYGPQLKKQILWDLFIKSKNASAIELFGTGNETRDYIFIDDIVRAIECMLKEDSFIGDVYNLGYGEAQSLKKVSNLLLGCLSWSGKLNFSGVTRIGDPDYWQADISKIKSLGFAPTVTLEEGIQKYAKWLSSLG
jgi:dTDP-glucose 4,6-dehydratase/UDP-glucose 4-epimerase